MKFRYAAFVFLLVAATSCNTGLAPLNEPSGFRGVIRFKNWPRPDSVQAISLVAFEKYPTDSSGIIPGLFAGIIAVYPDLSPEHRLPKYVDSIQYEFTLKNGINLQLKNYEYIILAQQYGPNVLTDWRPAGVYSTGTNSFTPSPVRVLLHRIIPAINIAVDFSNPPPKPWR
jgi:hypothetical protein